jgi:hypothetical protein
MNLGNVEHRCAELHEVEREFDRCPKCPTDVEVRKRNACEKHAEESDINEFDFIANVGFEQLGIERGAVRVCQARLERANHQHGRGNCPHPQRKTNHMQKHKQGIHSD